MKFFVIDGGKDETGPSHHDVKSEADRRLRESGWQDGRVKELLTGAAMPAALRYLKMQIDFVAETLSRLERIPADFRSDTYWPSAEITG
jgi:hypothetical protein